MRRFHQAIAVDPALYFPQQDNLDLNNIFLLVMRNVMKPLSSLF